MSGLRTTHFLLRRMFYEKCKCKIICHSGIWRERHPPPQAEPVCGAQRSAGKRTEHRREAAPHKRHTQAAHRHSMSVRHPKMRQVPKQLTAAPVPPPFPDAFSIIRWLPFVHFLPNFPTKPCLLAGSVIE